MPPAYHPPPATPADVPAPPARVVLAGVGVATAAWGVLFSGGRERFWTRAAAAGAAVGAYAVAVQPAVIGGLLRRPGRRWPRDVAVGAASGVALHGAFWIGEQFLAVAAPRVADEVADLYAVRAGSSRVWMPVVLAVAAGGEELFFRGFLQERVGWPAALATYASIHLWERKVILPVAALIGGVWWGALLERTDGLVAPLTSHLVWVMLTVWLRPATPAPATRRLAARVRPRLPRLLTGDPA